MNIEGKTISKVRPATKEETKGRGFIKPTDKYTMVLEFTDGTSYMITTESSLFRWTL